MAPLNLASCCTRLAGKCIHHKPWHGHAQSLLMYTRTSSCKILCPSIYICNHTTIQSYRWHCPAVLLSSFVCRFVHAHAHTHKYTNVIQRLHLPSSLRLNYTIWWCDFTYRSLFIVDYIRELSLKS